LTSFVADHQPGAILAGFCHAPVLISLSAMSPAGCVQHRAWARRPPMKSVVLKLPMFAFIVSTRAALAAGVGLLLADRIPGERRRRIGAALVAIGAATTVPAVIAVGRGARRRLPNEIHRDRALVGAVRLPRKGDDDTW
jgi:hypothetical protein